jgi:hypothetical protein
MIEQCLNWLKQFQLVLKVVYYSLYSGRCSVSNIMNRTYFQNIVLYSEYSMMDEVQKPNNSN